MDKLLVIVLALGLGLFQAFVVWKHYHWFLFPITNYAIGYFHIAGINAMVSAMRFKLDKDHLESEFNLEKSLKMIWTYFFGFACALLIGYIYSLLAF